MKIRDPMVSVFVRASVLQGMNTLEYEPLVLQRTMIMLLAAALP